MIYDKVKMGNDITLYYPETREDFLFITECMENEIYKNMIQQNIEERQEIFIIEYKQKNCGIFFAKIERINGLIIAKPIIYIKYKMTSASVFSILECLKFLIDKKNVNHIIIPVYRINKAMILILMKYDLNYNGVFKVNKKLSKKDLLYYSLNKDDIENFSNSYNEVFYEN